MLADGVARGGVSQTLLDSVLQRQVPQRVPPGPTQIQQPNITSVIGPLLNPLGDYEWRVAFSLPSPAAGDGFIIQKLTMRSENVETGAVLGEEHFFETWEVRAGRTIPLARHSSGYDDSYIFGNVDPARGIHGRNSHTGVVAFYEGPLPPEFGPYERGTHFYNTHRSTVTGWVGIGTRHDVIAEWDDRPGHPQYNHLQAWAGSREIRRGTWPP